MRRRGLHRITSYNVCYTKLLRHLEHRLLMTVPLYNLPRMHRLLRERGEDILLLFQHYADAASARHGLPSRGLQP